MAYVTKCSCGDEFQFETKEQADAYVELESATLKAHGVDMSKHRYTIEERPDYDTL